jgi:ferredoxin-nitrite reductase
MPPEACEPRRPVAKHGWLGVHRQSERGRNWIGVGIPVGRLSARQMHALAELATHYGRGELRLTVWQNLLLPHIPDAFVETVKRSVQRMGFFTETSLAAGGVIACTGNKGCKYSSADTKAHAVALIKVLAKRFPELSEPVNIHLTGCAHSCAQHYCGDLGLVSTKLADGTEGYHLVVGGGMDHEQGIGRELLRGVRAEELAKTVTKLLCDYLARRTAGETYVQWTRRHSVKELQEFYST